MTSTTAGHCRSATLLACVRCTHRIAPAPTTWPEDASYTLSQAGLSASWGAACGCVSALRLGHLPWPISILPMRTLVRTRRNLGSGLPRWTGWLGFDDTRALPFWPIVLHHLVNRPTRIFPQRPLHGPATTLKLFDLQMRAPLSSRDEGCLPVSNYQIY